MYAQLGDIVFEGLIGFESFNWEMSVRHNEHQLINAKPRTGVTGNDLDIITISTRFHADFCTPQDEINSLRKAKESFEVMPFVSGNGTPLGDYIITKLSVAVLHTADDGTYFDTRVDFTLQEYVIKDKQVQQEQDAKAGATGLEENKPKPVRGQMKAYQTPAGTLTTSTIFVGSDADELDRRIKEAKANPSKLDFVIGKIKEVTDNMNDYVNKINNAMTGNISAFVPDMPAAVASLAGAIGSMKASLGAGINTISDSNVILQQKVLDLKSAAAPAALLSISRKL